MAKRAWKSDRTADFYTARRAAGHCTAKVTGAGASGQSAKSLLWYVEGKHGVVGSGTAGSISTAKKRADALLAKCAVAPKLAGRTKKRSR